jgi:Hsp20/alpha crystallin family protein
VFDQAIGCRPVPVQTLHAAQHTLLFYHISVERTLTFPKPIDADKVTTNYQHGILTINFPLSEVSRPKKINVSGHQGGQSRAITVNNQ